LFSFRMFGNVTNSPTLRRANNVFTDRTFHLNSFWFNYDFTEEIKNIMTCKSDFVHKYEFTELRQLEL
jgi:hypothetical protein